MKGMTVIEMLIIICIIAIIASIAIPSLMTSSEVQMEKEGILQARKNACPLPECMDIWLKGNANENWWRWSVSEHGDLVSDYLVNLAEQEILKITNARKKRGYTLIPAGGKTESITKITVTLTWEKPKAK